MIYLVTPIFRLFVLALDVLEFLWGAYWDVVWTFLYLVFDKPVKSISGKTVLITGAANGVGRALAFAFAKQGCHVICWDVEEAGNQATAEEVQKAYKQVRAAAYRVDVTDREQVEKAVDKVREDFGFIDILVNNAGIMPAKQFLCHTPEEIKRIFNVNVFSQCWTLRALLPDMQRTGRGTVVSISSNCGLMGSPNLVPYCASKHAVRGLMEALTEEGRHLSKKRQPPVHYLTVFPFIINTRLAKYPRVRFPWLTPVLTPEYVAKETVKALMEGDEVLFFPKWMYPFFLFSRIWPRRTQQRFYDLLDTGLDENQFDVADQMRHFNAH